MIRAMIRLAACLLALLWATAATAQSLDVEALARQPGTTVTKKEDKSGDVTELSRAGVTITITSGGWTSMDRSGKAVWCLRDMAVGIQLTTDFCYPGEFVPLSRMLGEFIESADRFIVANNPYPITKQALEQNIAQRRAKAVAGLKAAGVPPAQNRICQQRRDDDVLPLAAELEKTRRELQHALAVPRWPARNPCD